MLIPPGSASQLLATPATSEPSVLTSGNTPEYGVPCFLFRSLVCQVGWLPDVETSGLPGGNSFPRHGAMTSL